MERAIDIIPESIKDLISASEEDIKTKLNIIYLILNRLNGMMYIGQTAKTFSKRYKGFKPNKHDAPRLYRAVKKYGKSSFYIYLLEHSKNKEDLDVLEEFYIEKYKTISPNGYNLNGGGKTNRILSEQTRERARKSQRARFLGDYSLYKDGIEYKFNSIAGFVEEMGWPQRYRSAVSMVLADKMKSIKGFHLKDANMKARNRKTKTRFLKKDDVVYEVDNIAAFCREHDLSTGAVGCLFKEKMVSHRGFTVLNPRKIKPKNKNYVYSRIIFKKENKIFDIKGLEEVKLFCSRNNIYHVS